MGDWTTGVSHYSWAVHDGDIGTAPVPGDTDGDLDVDGSDLATIVRSFNTSLGDTAYNPDADINMDGVVNAADLSVLAVKFGNPECQ